MKHITVRNTFATLFVVAIMGSTAAQASLLDNREIGHFTPSKDLASGKPVNGFAMGTVNAEVGHFAARVSTPDTNVTNDTDDSTEFSLR